MKRPPVMMHIKVKNKDVDFGLWLPLILIVLLAALIIIVLSPLIVLAMIIMLMVGMGNWVRFFVLAAWAALVAVWAMRGFEVDVDSAREHVSISVV